MSGTSRSLDSKMARSHRRGANVASKPVVWCLMKSHGIPSCIVDYMSSRDIVESDYYLHGSGRAIGWVRMAADELAELGGLPLVESDQKVAEYHAYMGISAARTSIDAFAGWLNMELHLGVSAAAVDLKKRRFRARVVEAAPSLTRSARRLGALARIIDRDRQRAQHREGSAILLYEAAGWHLTKGLQADRQLDKHLPTLLRAWADCIEHEACATVKVIGQSSLRTPMS